MGAILFVLGASVLAAMVFGCGTCGEVCRYSSENGFAPLSSLGQKLVSFVLPVLAIVSAYAVAVSCGSAVGVVILGPVDADVITRLFGVVNAFVAPIAYVVVAPRLLCLLRPFVAGGRAAKPLEKMTPGRNSGGVPFTAVLLLRRSDNALHACIHL